MEQPPQLPQRKPAPMPGHFRLGRVICRWWWLALLVMVIVTAIGYKTPDWFSMRGPLYQSTALLEVKPIPKFDTAAVTVPTHTPTHGTAGHHPTRFLSTQVEIIQAPATLELAIKQNDLLNRLGGSQTEVLHRMKKSLTVRQKYGTDLLDISYRDEDPTLAQDSLIVILESYAKRRAELAMQIRESEIKSLIAELENKNDQVEEERFRLSQFAREMGIIIEVDKNGAETIFSGKQQRDKAEKELYEANREKEKLKFQIEKLLIINDNENLMLLLADPKYRDPEFEELYQKYQKTKQELAVLRAQGLGPEHPSILQKVKAIAALKAKFSKRGIVTRDSLKRQLKLVEARVEKLKEILDDSHGRRFASNHDIQDFKLARIKFRKLEAARDEIQKKYDAMATRLGSNTTYHIIHQQPGLPSTPVTKGRDFFTTLFTLIAIPCAAITAITLIYLAEAIYPRRTTT